MSSGPWTNQLLDDMRRQGDKAADGAVIALSKRDDLPRVQQLLDQLVRNDDVPRADLPREIQDYFAQTADIPAPSLEAARPGQELFREYGPEISMLLAFCSLPIAYSARNGVQVLYRTGYLADRPLRRVAQ